MDRSDWILLLVSKAATGADGPDELDPIRIQKGMFLLGERGPARNLYAFRPYNWGPFSRDIYQDLDRLVSRGLLNAKQQPGQSWKRYSATLAGDEVASRLAGTLDGSSVAWMQQCRQFLTERTFSRLLKDVYEAYPGMATKSHFQS